MLPVAATTHDTHQFGGITMDTCYLVGKTFTWCDAAFSAFASAILKDQELISTTYTSIILNTD